MISNHQKSTNEFSKLVFYLNSFVTIKEFMNDISSGIDSLFNKINCDRSPIVEMLGEAGVTETNMMQVIR